MRPLVTGLAPGVVCLVLVSSAAASEPLDVSGSLRASWFSSTRDLDELHGVQAVTGELKLAQDVSDIHRFELEGRVSFYGPEGLERTHTQWNALSWHARFAHADLRVGQQKVRWGKADGINPIDFFTAVDYAGILPLEDDRYLSAPVARVDLHVDDTDSLSLVATADFTPSRLPWPRPSPVKLEANQPDTPQLGARWTHTGERLDWSLAGFKGHSTLPLLDAALDSGGSDVFVRHHAPIVGVGGDLARSLGRFGFRAELAHVSPESSAGLQSIRSSWHLVAGVDRSFPAWNFNVQAVIRHTPGFRPIADDASAAERFAATQNAIVHGQQRAWMYGMTARLVADWKNETLQTELLVVSQFDPVNYLVRPLVTYSVSDSTRVRAGAEYYHGPADTYFGALERNRTAFVEVQWYY